MGIRLAMLQQASEVARRSAVDDVVRAARAVVETHDDPSLLRRNEFTYWARIKAAREQLEEALRDYDLAVGR